MVGVVSLSFAKGGVMDNFMDSFFISFLFSGFLAAILFFDVPFARTISLMLTFMVTIISAYFYWWHMIYLFPLLYVLSIFYIMSWFFNGKMTVTQGLKHFFTFQFPKF